MTRVSKPQWALTWQVIFSIVVGLAMVLSNAISIEYIPNYKSDMGPEYFGSPFIMSTDTTWVNSFTGELYLKGLFSDVLIWGLLIYSVLLFLSRIQNKWARRIMLSLGTITFILAFAFVSMDLFIMDWRVHWNYTDADATNFHEEQYPEKRFHFFD
ncbi:MAG TPA: hypothetical protein DCX14_11110 [Flavobacteriales bacterium]|nr:hypothetical protein [Flavobacteriales bacterium]